MPHSVSYDLHQAEVLPNYIHLSDLLDQGQRKRRASDIFLDKAGQMRDEGRDGPSMAVIQFRDPTTESCRDFSRPIMANRLLPPIWEKHKQLAGLGEFEASKVLDLDRTTLTPCLVLGAEPRSTEAEPHQVISGTKATWADSWKGHPSALLQQ